MLSVCEIYVYKTKVPIPFHSKESLLANFVSPATILADSNCTFSSFATSRSKHPSHTSQSYSNVGLMKVRYIFDRVCLERVNFSFLRTLTYLKAAFTMLSIWLVQFPSDAKVNPKCLWFFTISTGSPLNRRSKCGTALVEITRALVFLGLKSTNHSPFV
jgi:hypothetical protein